MDEIQDVSGRRQKMDEGDLQTTHGQVQKPGQVQELGPAQELGEVPVAETRKETRDRANIMDSQWFRCPRRS